MKQAAVFVLALLLAGCTGYAHLGLSREEHRAYARSDSSCDGGARSRDVACYVPKSD
jgi:hypothetical protein